MEFNPGEEAFLLVSRRVKKSLYFRDEEGNVWSKEGKVVDHLNYLGERHTIYPETVEDLCSSKDRWSTRKVALLLGSKRALPAA